VSEFIFSAAADDRGFSQFEYAGLIIKKPADGLIAKLPALGDLGDSEVVFECGRLGSLCHGWFSSPLWHSEIPLGSIAESEGIAQLQMSFGEGAISENFIPPSESASSPKV
jgi:hypothetical protein